ncbi:type III PLP-dependent enzyme [Streptomyces sp. NPDC048282]|uniref:type III PLP-dependent enzyme n=1 Tax=Streptomyces sp. NPDC048282 TaxID=3365528 RepID=UPI0037226C1C
MDVDFGEVAGETVLALTELETPTYLYDLAAVRRAHGQLVRSLPDSAGLLYSLKANPHPAVLAQLAALGCDAEVSSPGELDAAIQAGFPSGRILYTGPGKRDEDVLRALSAGVRRFSVDSPYALAQLDRFVRTEHGAVSALLRVNPPVPPADAGLAMTGGPSQFGADLSWVLAQPHLFESREHVELAGLHLYMGSNLTREEALLAVFRYGLEVLEQVEKVMGRRLPVVDLGGGFGAPYAVHGELPRFDSLKSRLSALLEENLPDWPGGERRIVFESGRYLTAGCGSLLTRVLDVKRSHGRRVVVLDAGVNHLGGMSGLGAEDPIEPQFRVGAEPGEPAGRVRAVAQEKPERTIVAGPLCHPLDVWTRDGCLPDVSVGDIVTVSNVGAYGLHSALALFHCHPMPLEVVVDGGREVDRSRAFLDRGRSER